MERGCSILGPTQSRISPSMLQYTEIRPAPLSSEYGTYKTVKAHTRQSRHTLEMNKAPLTAELVGGCRAWVEVLGRRTARVR